MQKFIYLVLRNGLLFYFFVTIINGIRIADNNVSSNIIAGLLFGILMASVPSILKFFKLPVTSASYMLMALVVSFVFFFILYSEVAGLGAIGRSDINLGLGGAPIRLLEVQTMVVATVLTALSVAGLEALSKSR